MVRRGQGADEDLGLRDRERSEFRSGRQRRKGATQNCLGRRRDNQGLNVVRLAAHAIFIRRAGKRRVPRRPGMGMHGATGAGATGAGRSGGENDGGG